MKISPTALRRLEKLEAAAPKGGGNWVRSLSGAIVWDSYDPAAITDEEAAATMTRLRARLEDMAAKVRASPDYKPPTEEQKAEARRHFEQGRERYRDEWAAVRAFTAQVERERRKAA